MVWNRVHPFSPHLNVMSVLHKKSFQILSTFKFWPSSERFGGFGKKSLSNAFDLEVLNASWTLWWFWKKKFFKCIQPSSFERHPRAMAVWEKNFRNAFDLQVLNVIWDPSDRYGGLGKKVFQKEVWYCKIRFDIKRLDLKRKSDSRKSDSRIFD